MTTLQVLIVDDEALARARLQTLLTDCTAPQAHVVGMAADAVQAVDFLQHHAVDVVLADIHMPGTDGLAMAQVLRTMLHPPALVFVTAHAEYAVRAFDLEAIDYLTKPVRLERLQVALQKVERLQQSLQTQMLVVPEDVLVIHDRGQLQRVPLALVVYLKAELKYITVRTASKSYVLEGALADLEAKYAERFIRVHRNALVARHCVLALEKHHDPCDGDCWAVRLRGADERLLVSRRQLAAVRDLLTA